jgi:hypothetical protein
MMIKLQKRMIINLTGERPGSWCMDKAVLLKWGLLPAFTSPIVQYSDIVSKRIAQSRLKIASWRCSDYNRKQEV